MNDADLRKTIGLVLTETGGEVDVLHPLADDMLATMRRLGLDMEQVRDNGDHVLDTVMKNGRYKCSRCGHSVSDADNGGHVLNSLWYKGARFIGYQPPPCESKN